MKRFRPDPGDVERTGEMMCKARRILAYGGLDGIVQRPLYYDDEGVFPQFVQSACGYEFFDTTGQSYVDWVNGWGPVLLGYRRPEVEEAIRAQLAAGPTLSLMHTIEIEVASALTEMIPCAEMVAFGKNGSDVLAAAARVARDVTRRQIILQYGMHGFHDWYVCVHPEVGGMPEGLSDLIHPFPYNDVKALKKLLKRFNGEVAAVVMEPVRECMPQPGYLEKVLDLTHRSGALLIFDEVVTALRLGNGGAQEFLGVVPDLACLGKSMGNGMPLSAVVGKREYMQRLPGVGFGMTFRGETLSLAAARATLKICREEPVAEHLARIGEAVRKGFHEECSQRGIRCELGGPPARMTFLFQDEGDLSAATLRTLFLQECLKEGIFTNGNLLPSYAHDDKAVELTLEGFSAALKVVAEAIRSGRVAQEPKVGGSPDGPRPMIASGFIDQMREDGTGLVLSGWMLLEEAVPDSVVILGPEGERCATQQFERPDLAQAFPHVKGAKNSGYAAFLPEKSFYRKGRYDFTICAMRKNEIAFRCRVLRRSPSPPGGGYWTGDGVLYL